MAATKRKTTKSTKTKSTRTKQDQSLAARTGRTVKNQPYVSAAIATGAVAAVAAAAAGAYFFRKSEKTVGELADEAGEKIKEGYADAKVAASGVARKAKVKATEARIKAKEAGLKARGKAQMFFADDTKDQSDFAAEALTLKETGKKNATPIDDTIDTEIKTGAISY